MRTREFHYRCDTNKKIHCGEIYDTVIWIIHDKLTHSLVVQRDQRTEMQKTNNVFILSVCLPSTTRVMVIISSLDC